jgi:DNA-binding beta-propeller fold protein YncE
MLHILCCIFSIVTFCGTAICQKTVLIKISSISFEKVERFHKAGSLTFAADGGLYVSEPASGRIFRFDTSGVLISSSAGGASSRISRPEGIARGRGFALYVADTDGRQLLRFSDDLTDINTFKIDHTSQNSLFHPYAVDISKDGLLYVTDEYDGNVLVISQDGSVAPFFAQSKSSLSQFIKPYAISTLKNIYVADKKSGRIHVFDRFSTRVTVFGDSLSFSPHGLAFIDSTLFVSDTRTQAILTFTQEGAPVDTFFLSDSIGLIIPGALSSERKRLAVIHANRKDAAIYKVP